MANAAVVQARRDQIRQQWLRGKSAEAIARELRVPLGTVKHDITSIRAKLLVEHADDLASLQARALAGVRDVLREAWERYTALLEHPPEEGAEREVRAWIDTFLRAHQLLARLGGVLSPNFLITQHSTTVNVLASDEWTAARSALLSALEGYPDAKHAVIEALRAARAIAPLATVEAGGSDGRAVG